MKMNVYGLVYEVEGFISGTFVSINYYLVQYTLLTQERSQKATVKIG